MTDTTEEVLPVPCGHKILVKVDSLRPKSMIAIPDSAKSRHEDGTTTGTLVAIGKQAWQQFNDGTPWAKLGDHVSFGRYAGREIRTNDDTLYRVLNDDDLDLVIPENYTAGVKQSV